MSLNKGWQETFWMDESGEHKITIVGVLDLLKDEPIVNMKLEELAHIKDLSRCDHQVREADLSCPIIVVEKEDHYDWILDGHHRRRKALDESRVFICAKILRISCIPVQFHWLAS